MCEVGAAAQVLAAGLEDDVPAERLPRCDRLFLGVDVLPGPQVDAVAGEQRVHLLGREHGTAGRGSEHLPYECPRVTGAVIERDVELAVVARMPTRRS